MTDEITNHDEGFTLDCTHIGLFDPIFKVKLMESLEAIPTAEEDDVPEVPAQPPED